MKVVSRSLCVPGGILAAAALVRRRQWRAQDDDVRVHGARARGRLAQQGHVIHGVSPACPRPIPVPGSARSRFAGNGWPALRPHCSGAQTLPRNRRSAGCPGRRAEIVGARPPRPVGRAVEPRDHLQARGSSARRTISSNLAQRRFAVLVVVRSTPGRNSSSDQGNSCFIQRMPASCASCSGLVFLEADRPRAPGRRARRGG